MEQILEKAAGQVPALAVLTFVVVVFLKYLTKRDREFEMFLKEVHEEHIDARTESRRAIEKNTVATDRLNETLTNIRIDIKNVGKP